MMRMSSALRPRPNSPTCSRRTSAQPASKSWWSRSRRCKDFPIEDYGYQLGRYWGIGQKGKNTGAILIVAPKERKVRIEVGYGLEGKLTDAISRTIIENDIVPNFRRGDYNAGVAAATTSILKVLGGASIPSSAESSAPADSKGFGLPLLAMAVWLALVIILNRLRRSDYLIRHGVYISGGDFSSGGGFSGGGGGGGFSGGGGSFGGGGASGSW